MNVEYKVNSPILASQFIDLLEKSMLGKRRPVEDLTCIEGMVKNSNLMVSAWIDGKLVGIARSMTDFHYACYLSDLAVDKAYQNKGIGKMLQVITQEQLEPKCKLILIASPKANSYYAKAGYENNLRCWVLERSKHITTNT